MKLSNVLLGLTGCFFAASLSGCFVVASDDPLPAAGTGSITIALSFDGRADQSDCDYFNVDSLEVDILEDESLVTTVSSNCRNMGMTIDNILPGRYAVEAKLIAGNAVVSESAFGNNILVTRNADALVEVDFPSESIH